MPAIFTVDASVFLNAFNPFEAGHADSNRFLAYLQEQAIPIIVPSLVLPEVAAAISRGSGNIEWAREFASILERLPHLVLVPLDAVLARQAVDVAAAHRLRGSDAVYVAVALRFGSVLATLDREQHDRAAGALTTFYPTEALAEIR
jgi:predicted nucleic acid-binding protein